ncbi:MAG: four helix bundle protein [Opitutaceae bacterium]|nr:four helix bundle protein [Opitutaceae bacterium]
MSSTEANRLLEERTLAFAVSIVHFVAGFARSDASGVVGRQLLKSGTSIGANYREANRAESRDDFIHKTAIVLKEAAESDYWLELCVRTDFGDVVQREALCREARELLAIFTTINRRAKGR